MYSWRKYDVSKYNNDAPISGMIASSILGMLFLVGMGCNAYTAALNLINPEYYALHEILQTLGK